VLHEQRLRSTLYFVTKGDDKLILISACLLGRNVKYNGSNNLVVWLEKYYDPKLFLAICPEVMVGFSIPRPAVEIQGGDGEKLVQEFLHKQELDVSIHNKQGLDITRPFSREITVLQALVRKHNVQYAILKERSPSCGVAQIYDGSFSGVRIKGKGVATAALEKAGVTCYSEETLTETRLQEIIKLEARREKSE